MTDLDLDALLALAVDVAAEAAALLLEGATRTRTHVGTKSSATDMVTEMDRASEALVVRRLLAARPDDSIKGEEGAAHEGTSGLTWVLDPLDGTTNYLYGIPQYGVSIAAELDGHGVVGVVHDVAKREVFAAAKDHGATLDGLPIRATDQAELATALVGTGFNYDLAVKAEQAAVIGRMIPHVRDLRRGGAAAIDLCWVAAGRLDAFFERGLAHWDHAAGAVVAREAGARVLLAEGGGYTASIVAAAPGIATAFTTLLRDAGHPVPD